MLRKKLKDLRIARKNQMTTQFIAVFDSVVYSSWLFIIAVGLTLIFGVMKILNIAHGSLYALGAYTAAYFSGIWINLGYTPYFTFIIMILSALLVGLTFGYIIERGILRLMYGKDEIVLVLVTYAVFLILEDFIKIVWGVNPYFLYQPYSILGSFNISELTYPNYNILLFLLASLVGIVVTSKKTKKGKFISMMHDHEISSAKLMSRESAYLLLLVQL